MLQSIEIDTNTENNTEIKNNVLKLRKKAVKITINEPMYLRSKLCSP